jgi:hypothetical protein
MEIPEANGFLTPAAWAMNNKFKNPDTLPLLTVTALFIDT